MDEGRRPDRAAEAERHACERAQAHLPDDLLLVLADVLLDRYPERHPRRPLCRQPGRVQLPEVDRRGDDDRAAGDGGYGGRDLRAALLLPDGQAERDRSPHDQEAAEEGHAARHELDDVCEHAALLCFRLTMFLAVPPPRRGRPAPSAAPSRGAILPPAVLREVERAAARGLLEQARARVALEPVLPVHERHAPVHEHERVLARHARHLGGLYEVALGDAAVHGPGPAGAPRVALRLARHRLLAGHLADLLVGLVRLAAQVEQRVAGVHDGLGVVVAVGLLQLRERLGDHRDGDVPAAGDGDGPLEVGYAPDVGELVEDEVHRRGQRAAVRLERLGAKRAHGRIHEQGEQEVEGRVGVAHRREERDLGALVAHVGEVELVFGGEVAHGADGKRLQADVAAREHRLHGVAGGHAELAVAREREVVGRRGLADLDPLPRAVLLGKAAQRSALRRGAAAPDVALAGLQLAEHHVERAHVARVVAGVGEREQREQPVEVSVGGLAVHDEVGRERGVDQALGLLPVGVAFVVGLALGVGDDAAGEADDARLVAYVGYGVEAHGAREVDGVERADLVAELRQRAAHLADERALRVGHEEAGVGLQEVRLDVVARLAGAGSSHHEHVVVGVGGEVEPAAHEADACVVGEDDVVVGVLGVAEGRDVLARGPPGATVLLAVAPGPLGPQ